MSQLSKLLGLDKHPSVLLALNNTGHALAPALPAETKIEDAIHAAVGTGVSRALGFLPIPEEEKGLAAIWLTGLVNGEIAAVLAQYEHVPDAPKAAEAAAVDLPTAAPPAAPDKPHTLLGDMVAVVSDHVHLSPMHLGPGGQTP